MSYKQATNIMLKILVALAAGMMLASIALAVTAMLYQEPGLGLIGLGWFIAGAAIAALERWARKQLRLMA